MILTEKMIHPNFELGLGLGLYSNFDQNSSVFLQFWSHHGFPPWPGLLLAPWDLFWDKALHDFDQINPH